MVTMRGTKNDATGKKALHIVSAWFSNNSLVLGQRKTSEKSNEITAIPQLLDILDLTGAVITIDSMGTQKDIAKKIISKEADSEISKGHGRIERRDAFITSDIIFAAQMLILKNLHTP